MPFADFFSDMTMIGADGKRGIFSRVALVGLVLGAGVGGYLGYLTGGVVQAMGGVALGAFLGWVLGLALRGFAVFLVIFAVILAATLGWKWVTGGLG